MNPSDDKQLFLDMQEHPEKYSDQELEAMMDSLDREPDAEAAWQRFHTSHGMKVEDNRRHPRRARFSLLRKIAAAVLFAFACGVLGYASYKTFSIRKRRAKTSISAPERKVRQAEVATVAPDTLFRFANVQLDSILSMVGQHYGRQVLFRDSKARTLRLHTLWKSNQPLDEFVEMLNEFEVFRITDERDTLFVESIEME